MSREGLLGVLANAASDRLNQRAAEAHRKLKLPEPTIEDIARYRKSGYPDIELLAVQRYVDSLLDVRTKPLPTGGLKQPVRDLQEEILFVLKSSINPSGRIKTEYDKLALSFSRLIAVYYRHENDHRPKKLEGRLNEILPYLARHLLVEVQLCIVELFGQPFRNLSKVSIFDIQNKLDMLQVHSEVVVRENARTIVNAALRRGNLELADELAAGAKAKLDMLQTHSDKRIRKIAKTILSRLISDGNLDGPI